MNLTRTAALALMMTCPGMAAADWTGLYAGAEIGGIDGGPVAGAFLGAQIQVWDIVAGVEIGYDELLGDTNTTGQAGLGYTSFGYRLGWAFDDVLAYTGYSGSITETENLDNFDVEAVFELGVDYQYRENVVLALQYKGQLSIFDTSEDEDNLVQGLSLRAAYKF